MTIYLNGELREVPENLTLAALLDWLKLPAERVAVERNPDRRSIYVGADDHPAG